MIARTEVAPRPRLLCIDPGSSASGVVLLDLDIPSGPVVWAAKVENHDLVGWLRSRAVVGGPDLSGPHVLVVEMIASYGMRVGAEVFETCVMIGRCLESWSGESVRIFRREVKLAMCGSPRANDADIRHAILDRFGGKSAALARPTKCPTCKGAGKFGIGRGSKRTTHDCHACGKTGLVGAPGPLHGVIRDCWSALALGLTYSESAPVGAKEA